LERQWRCLATRIGHLVQLITNHLVIQLQSVLVLELGQLLLGVGEEIGVVTNTDGVVVRKSAQITVQVQVIRIVQHD